MLDDDKRFQEYYTTGEYKGFQKVSDNSYKLFFSLHLTFSNGNREIFASGVFKEEALKNIFDKIDDFHKTNSASYNRSKAIDDIEALHIGDH